jgi:hypothetical protein|tara:strand:+ start:2065 stop:2985 length:921 start_codon:yes stop_codon:yes gene_type:complete
MGESMTEELDFNVGEDEQEATVEMNEDGSDAKLSEEESPLVEQKEKGGPAENELEEYSGKVKKRIDKLTARLRETQRREEAALEFAKNVQQQNQKLEQVYQQTDTQRLEEIQNRVGTQLMALKHVIKKAREEGDIDTETEAQQRLTTMVMEQQRVNDTTDNRRRQAQNPRQIEQPQILRPRTAEPDVLAEEWAEKNAWFGQNTVMTHTVRGIHMDLIQKEGFDPSSDEYYSEIDRRMSQIFPSEYDSNSTQQNNRKNRPVQTVAPATRSSGVNNSARRSVRLSPSQVAIAKKLGVPLEEYAKYVKE